MTGLRARQKEDRDRRIVEAAAALFRKQGYDAVKMEAIAAEADVSIGTIYNYYRNKGDLLVAIVAMEVNEVINAGEAVTLAPGDDAEEAVARLFAIYLEHSLVYLSKAMWRHAMAISTQQPDSPSGRLYAGLDRELTRQVCRLVAQLQRQGLLRGNLDTTAAGEILFNNMNMMFTIYVKTEVMSLAELSARLARQNRVVLQAIKADA